MDINKVNKQHGFTIIEVALVLAIAGLIFLVVFLALPALQNSQKDTARRQDVGRVVSALQSYMADNQGSLDSLAGVSDGSDGGWYGADGSATSGFSSYLGTLSQTKYVWVAPIGTPYYGDPISYHSVIVFPGMQCNGNAATSSSDAAVTVTLSTGKIYCASM